MVYFIMNVPRVKKKLRYMIEKKIYRDDVY